MSFLLPVTDDDSINAINQATRCLADALQHAGHETLISVWAPSRLNLTGVESDVVVIPYNPFMWGRWGFAPKLLVNVLRIRLMRTRPLIVLIIHEPYVPWRGGRALVMAVWQRVQLFILMLAADRRFASIERWSEHLSRVKATGHLPSGSTLPDARSQREELRRRLGLDDDTIGVATLTSGHPSHLRAHAETAIEALVQKGVRVVWFKLGADQSRSDLPPGVRVERPGVQNIDALAGYLAAMDVLLVPFIDGVSTRRTSFMAGLSEQVALVGTRGRLTDSVLLNAGLCLVDVEDLDGYVAQVKRVALDVTLRHELASKGRALFENRFTWDRIAATLLASL